MSRKLAVAVVVSLCLGVAPGTAAASALLPQFTPGAPGLGDPYFPRDGNGGYDVEHYGLDLAYDPDTDELSGSESIRARATQDLSSFNLDLVGMNVRAISVDGRSAGWSRDGDELTVIPHPGLLMHHAFSVSVVYDGVPQTLPDGSGFVHTDDGTLVAGQPDGAATWHPVNDHPRDKASYTFRVTVPEGLEAVANGVLQSARTLDGRTTWVWDAREPMASYLATVDIGEFEIDAYRAGGIRYWDAIDPDLFGGSTSSEGAGERARAAFARQPEIIGFLEGVFGPYPFTAAGGIVDDHAGLGFALETQTRPVYAREWFEDPADPGISVIVHELAHQWAGDSLTIDAWRDIWLNEGFATYTEWLWSEREGDATAQQMYDRFATIPADDPFWTVVIGDPGPDHVLDIAIYFRGAMTLHALRREIGDPDFFRLLRTWAQSRKGDNVRIEEFVALAEQISGRDLDAFFATWLFSAEKPLALRQGAER